MTILTRWQSVNEAACWFATSFKFTLRHADERLNDVRTAEAASLPANTHAERRDLARLRVVRDQIKEIEQQRLQRIEQAAPSEKGSHAMLRLLARCPSSDNLRLIRQFEKGGSGSSGLEFKRPAVGAASDGLRWWQA